MVNESLKDEILLIDRHIDSGEYQNAIEILSRLINEYPNEGVVPFYLGHLSQIGHENELALKYYSTAIKMGYVNADAYFSVAMLQKEFGQISEAEKSFNKALELSVDDVEKWACYSSLAILYLENKMYLKAEKISKLLVEKYSDNYEGYHIHIIAEALRGNIDDVKAYMEKLPEKFKTHPQYLIDKIDLCKFEGNKDELSALLNDEAINTVIPQITLREKLSQMPHNEFAEEKAKIIETLAKKYHDSDAIISMMVVEFANKNFKKSAQIANVILENEKVNQGIRYYLALFFQIYNLYYLSEKNPSAELRKWIESAGNWCIAFAERLALTEIDNTVRDAIRELFDEINEKA